MIIAIYIYIYTYICICIHMYMCVYTCIYMSVYLSSLGRREYDSNTRGDLLARYLARFVGSPRFVFTYSSRFVHTRRDLLARYLAEWAPTAIFHTKNCQTKNLGVTIPKSQRLEIRRCTKKTHLLRFRICLTQTPELSILSLKIGRT